MNLLSSRMGVLSGYAHEDGEEVGKDGDEGSVMPFTGGSGEHRELNSWKGAARILLGEGCRKRFPANVPNCKGNIRGATSRRLLSALQKCTPKNIRH